MRGKRVFNYKAIHIVFTIKNSCYVWRAISDVQLLQVVDGGCYARMRNDLARHAMKNEGVTGVEVEKVECWAAGG